MGGRLAIYVQYDPKGAVRDYVPYCLQGLKEVVDEILVVINGELSDKGLRVLSDLPGINILRRENKGFDFGGWKAGLEYYGYDNLAALDALLLTNNSYYGPIYPFEEMWTAMDGVECDFWGINRHPDSDNYIIENNPETRIKSHLQSYWLVFRKAVLESGCFSSYWKNIKVQNSFRDAVSYGEIPLTASFEKMGFKSASYINGQKYDQLLKGLNPLLFADLQARYDRSPVIKRKTFSDSDYRYSVWHNREGYNVKNLLNYIAQNNLYDRKLIWDDLLANEYLSELNESLDLNYVLPSANCGNAGLADSKNTALILYLANEESLVDCLDFIEAMPPNAAVVVVSCEDETLSASRAYFSKLPYEIYYRLQSPGAGGAAALLISAGDVVEQSDYVCLIHTDSFVGEFSRAPRDQIYDYDQRRHCFRCLLCNRQYVSNLISAMENDANLGLMIAPVPACSDYRHAEYDHWGEEGYEETKKLFTSWFDLDLKLDPRVIVPFGGMFWAKTEALKSITSRNWQIEDFVKNEAVIMRLWTTLGQLDGFYTASVMPDTYAGTVISNLRFWIKVIYSQNDQPMRDIRRLPAMRSRLKRYKLLARLGGKMGRHYQLKRNNMEKLIHRAEAIINACRLK